MNEDKNDNNRGQVCRRGSEVVLSIRMDSIYINHEKQY